MALNGVLLVALVVFASGCASADDLPDGISAPPIVEASTAPAPPFSEVDGMDRLPEAFREPAAAVVEISGQGLFGFFGIEFLDPSEVTFDPPDVGSEALVGPIRYAFGQSISIDANDRASAFDDVFAYYRRGRVTWPSPGGVEPSSLSHLERVLAVHEISHVQTQVYRQMYVGRLLNQEAVGAFDVEVFEGVSEGIADYFAGVYLAAMPPAAQQDVREDRARAIAESQAQLNTQAGAEFLARYVLGERLFEVVDLSHPEIDHPGDVVELVLRELPMLSSSSFLDPWTHVGNGIEIVSLPRPEASEPTELDALAIDNSMNALDWYLMLAPVVGDRDALEAARRVVSWSRIGEVDAPGDQQQCFQAAVESSGTGELMAAALAKWADADEQNRSSEDAGNTTIVTGCTPLPGADPVDLGDPRTSLRYVTMMIDAETETARQGADRSVAGCAVDQFLEAQAGDALSFGDVELYGSVLDQLVSRCAE